MSLDLETVEAFLEKAGDGPVLVFGFTYMVWKYFYEPLKRSGHRLHLEHGFLIHGGGWKKLSEGRRCPQRNSGTDSGKSAGSSMYGITTEWRSRPAASTWNASAVICM